MSAPKRRIATYEATLVHMDEPLVLTLTSGKSRLIAVAIPHEDANSYHFFATTVSTKDWERYLDGHVDLRYLYTYPDKRNTYTFDLSTIKQNKLYLEPFLEQTPERYLPSPKFFSSNHTEEYIAQDRPEEISRLFVDGEWELVEFGQFNQRYADIYAFTVALKNWADPDISAELKRKIRAPFLDRPYQGGFSYVHLFNDLNDNVPRSEQLSLDKIQYASPGYVDIFGKNEIFKEVQELVINFLENRRDILSSYSALYSYLHKNGYLRLSGDHYPKGDPSEKYILSQTESLNFKMKAAEFSTVSELTNSNALVSAKVVMSFYRRLNELSSFFAQGRISFEKD